MCLETMDGCYVKACADGKHLDEMETLENIQVTGCTPSINTLRPPHLRPIQSC